MSRTYIVRTVEFGDVRKAEDSVKAARKWARSAFGPTATVTPERNYRHCDRCSCAPCDCPKRRP